MVADGNGVTEDLRVDADGDGLAAAVSLGCHCRGHVDPPNDGPAENAVPLRIHLL